MFVLDTITFKCDFPLRVTSHDDWIFTIVERDLPLLIEGQEEDCRVKSFKAHHRILGIYIQGVMAYTGSRITSVTASLARMVHGNNGELIANQQQLNNALAFLIQMIGEIADTGSGVHHFTRVDLCWQFLHSPAAIIRALRQSVFPRCRRSKREFGEDSAAWEYCGKRIVIYDKTFESTGTRGNVVRVEVQLRKQALKKYLGGDNQQVTQLNFARCYQVYREVMTTFAPSVTVDTPTTFYEALAVVEENAHAAGSPSPMDIILSTMNERTGRDWRRKFTAAQLRRENFLWEEKLPESGPPDIVNIP